MDEPFNYQLHGGGDGGSSQRGTLGAGHVGYSMPQVLDYLQSEWFRFEVDRSHWIAEKTEYINRISQLESDKKLNEIMTNDLCRRIKMLEYALYQERLKNGSVIYKESEPVFKSETNGQVEKVGEKESVTRNLIKKYLSSIGYQDVIIAKPQFFEQQNQQDVSNKEDTLDPKQITALLVSANGNVTGKNKKMSFSSSSSSSSSTSSSPPFDSSKENTPPELKGLDLSSSLSNLDQLESSSPDSFDNLKQLDNINNSNGNNYSHTDTPNVFSPPTPSIEVSESSTSSNGNEPYEGSPVLNEDFFNKLASNSKGRMKLKLDGMKFDDGGFDYNGSIGSTGSSSSGNSASSGTGGSIGSASGSTIASNNGVAKNKVKSSGLSSKSGSMRKKMMSNIDQVEVSDLNDITLEDTNKTNDLSPQRIWKYKASLKSHFDGVRSVQFHPNLPLLISTSEDHTCKLWDLSHLIVGSVSSKKAASIEPEPIYTYRGHLGSVFASALTANGDGFYSAGYDMIIKQWKLPPIELDHYHQHGYAVNYQEMEFVGHSDGIWDLLVVPNQNILLSASSDGSIISWDTRSTQQFSTFVHPLGRDRVPTSLSLPSTEDNRKLLASYNDRSILMFDIETGKYDQIAEGVSPIDSGRQINKMVSHPTLSLVITGTEDHKIEFFDYNSPSPIVHSMVAHTNSISSLDIDPSGLYVASSSHDSTIRFWDISSKTCVQDLVSLHRPKYDESVNCIKYHPIKGYFASGGSDSIIRIHQ